MDKALKQRMIGAVVLIALAVIFIPMLLDGGGERGTETVPLEIPAPPDNSFRSRLLPLDGSLESTQAGPVNEPGPVDAAPLQADRVPPDVAPARTAASNSEETGAGGPAPAARPPQSPREADESAVSADSAPTALARRETGNTLANWFVQVGSFAEQSNARDLRDKLRAAGYSAFVESVTVSGTQTHRVLVGPQMDESRAESVRDEIQASTGLKGLVISELQGGL